MKGLNIYYYLIIHCKKMVRVNWNVRRKFGRGIEIENRKVEERKKRGYGFWAET